MLQVNVRCKTGTYRQNAIYVPKVNKSYQAPYMAHIAMHTRETPHPILWEECGFREYCYYIVSIITCG